MLLDIHLRKPHSLNLSMMKRRQKYVSRVPGYIDRWNTMLAGSGISHFLHRLSGTCSHSLQSAANGFETEWPLLCRRMAEVIGAQR